jgi:hypothetical protein
MKRKFTKILGVGLTLVLLASLTAFAIPVSAAPLKWTPETIPSTTGNMLAPATHNINDLAAHGDTIYSVSDNADGGLYKSTDAGSTWTNMMTSTLYPEVDLIAVAVAPDDPDQVIMASTTNVYYSSNGGSLWSNLGVPATGATIYDIDISPAAAGTHYVAVGASIGGVGEMYTIKLATAENWQARSGHTAAAGNFTAQDAVFAVKCSPNFATDKIITCISGDTTSGIPLFQVFRYESGAYTWNNAITFYTGDGYANGVAVGTAVALTTASITLSVDYLGTEEQERIGFVGLAPSGAYRVNDSYVKELTTWSGGPEGPIHSVAYHEDGKLLAGDSDESQVYTCLDPLATSPKFERLTSYKQPGGTVMVVVAWSDDTAVAGTSGDESAFAISTDDGESFNDISLIDTTLATLTDVAVTDDGMIYLASYENTEVSLWVKSTSWMRVLSLQGLSAVDGHVRLAPDDGEVVYLGFIGSQDIYVSTNAGKESWKYVPCYKLTASGNLLDFVVEDEDTAYALDAAGVSKTTNSGASWGSKKPMDGVGGYMITLAPNGDVLVGGSDGKVAFSTDGGSTFTSTEKTVGNASGNVIVVADADYDDNSTIYACSDAPKTLYRATTSKTTKFSDRGPTLTDSSYSIQGMLEVEGRIYALSSNGTNSKLWRNIGAPIATADTAGSIGWSGRTTGSGLTAAPKALVVSEGPVFYAITGTSLLSMTDPIAFEGPVLNLPADGDKIPVNPQTGRAYTITFSYDRYHSAEVDKMEIVISTDSKFAGSVYSKSDITIRKDSESVTIGPNAQLEAEFMPGYTYYWRMRMTGVGGDTFKSPWSEVRSFEVESLGAIPTSLSAPPAGASGVSLMPSFSWTATEGAVSYNFEIAKDAAFTVPGWKRSKLANPVYLAEHELEYDTTYFWRAQAVFQAKPLIAGPWAQGTFTTMSPPLAPEAEKFICPYDGLVFDSQQALSDHINQYHANLLNPPAPAPAIPTYMLWIIVGIGAVLFIALIVLIVRTRRVV